MKLLLDTHTFIWWDSDPTKLSPTALALCQEIKNARIISVVTIWEMQIKSQTGKLKFNLPLAQIIENQLKTNKLEVLPVKLAHVLELEKLPNHHKDPFDRLLIAQANVENAVLISRDPVFAQYPVKLAW